MVGSHDLILDCFTDEHSGYGVPPFLNTHARYLAGALSLQGRQWHYITIDDLRYARSTPKPTESDTSSNKEIRNTTLNRDRADELLESAECVYVIMGQFVDYEYVSARPPRPAEVEGFLSGILGRKVLVYVLSTLNEAGIRIKSAFSEGTFDTITTQPGHEFILGRQSDLRTLREIAIRGAEVLAHIRNHVMVEIETARGCNWKPGCSFCVETALKLDPVYRSVESILAEVATCYSYGAQYFRLGRQPNLFDYQRGDPDSMKMLLAGIREACPSIQTLHVDNTSPQDVVTANGRQITKLIAEFCTSGNIGSFGVESIDPIVRQRNRLNSTPEEILEAIRVFNEYGAQRGDDGLPVFLPGLNIIYGLNGQNAHTLEINLLWLRRVLDEGLLTRRTFVRGLTEMSGYLTERSKRFLRSHGEGLAFWQQEIERQFTSPMLERVLPRGRVVKRGRAEIWSPTGTIFRQMATCGIRFETRDQFIAPDSFRDLRVLEHTGPRDVLAEVV